MASTTPGVLVQRLLKMFPVKLLREQYSIKGNSQTNVIDEVIKNNTQQSIKKFCFDWMDCTKQHVYLYTLNKPFDIRNFQNTDFIYPITEISRSSTEITLFCLPIVTHSVTLINPYATTDLQFYQPIKITIKGKLVIVHFTILEKSVETYYPSGRFVVAKRDLEEENFKADILQFFQANYTVNINDFNKGIKHLWNTDVVDSKFVKFKKAKSTSTEAMDEGETVKKSLPVEYSNLMSAPLQKTIIKYIQDNDDLCDLFTVDPTKGEISFTKYPANKNQIENVINQILSNN